MPSQVEGDQDDDQLKDDLFSGGPNSGLSILEKIPLLLFYSLSDGQAKLFLFVEHFDILKVAFKSYLEISMKDLNHPKKTSKCNLKPFEI